MNVRTITKICIKCNKVKPFRGFYKHQGMKDGYFNKCIICARKEASKHRSDNLDYYKNYLDNYRARQRRLNDF